MLTNEQPHSAAQISIERTRAVLLAGHGPGASGTVVARHTRDRTALAGQPVAARRQKVAHQTALARGDPNALAGQTIIAAHLLGADLDAITAKIRPAHAVGVRLAWTAAAVGVVLGATVTVILGATAAPRRL